jgi:Zn-dependent protease
MGLAALLFREPATFFMLAIPLLYSVIVHEVSHGLVAYLFGDSTAKDAGRLTANPMAHLDPAGTLMLFFVGFGWAKPVPVNYANIKNFRAGLICVSLAGCFANILVATMIYFYLNAQGLLINSPLVKTLLIVARVNIILGAFNLIPIPPLDGSKVLMGFLPRDLQIKLARLEPYGFPLLIILLFTGLLDPVIGFMQGVISALINGLLGLT